MRKDRAWGIIWLSWEYQRENTQQCAKVKECEQRCKSCQRRSVAENATLLNCLILPVKTVVNKLDPRHKRRLLVVQNIFSQFFNTQDLPHSQDEQILKFTEKILEKKDQLEKIIAKYSPKVPIDKIAKIDLAILYLAVYELVFERKNPPKVIINEAVNLAKELGAERSYAFVNAVLGKVYQEYGLEKSGEKN